ncbi:hypothetical protein PN471_11540 [Aphanizomenon sp. CS-733/32]|uniref:hypothetical protein n=1 Tax=Aphanizomenon sp. CS-733/32 TaxID=3021715 RepID=UPI00232C78A0|nr:hypothetical protein [Aphanizomenon sp. CS-733/32]MDB9309251.1 hypothetical protein [Aphanizomenon sp. CS-733/32]
MYEYEEVPLSLYIHALSEEKIPVSQYLHYYQVIECYFPKCLQEFDYRWCLKLRSLKYLNSS